MVFVFAVSFIHPIILLGEAVSAGAVFLQCMKHVHNSFRSSYLFSAVVVGITLEHVFLTHPRLQSVKEAVEVDTLNGRNHQHKA